MWSYEKEQERLHKLMTDTLEECEEDVQDTFDDDTDDDEEDVLETQILDTDTEQEVSDIEEEEAPRLGPHFVGKDNTLWSKHVPPTTRTRTENLITRLPGVKPQVETLKGICEIWKHFFNAEMIRVIVQCTNIHIQSVKENYSRERNAKETDVVEIEALFGLLYLAGVLKSSRLNVDDLWGTNGSGYEQFRLTMSKARFQFLLQHLRFDDINSRVERRKFDKLAPIRSIFESFVFNCQSAYTPFQNVTIDEKLEAFRGRCSFRQYIPSKPNKYGIKIYALVDSKTYYTSNLEVYVGVQPQGPYFLDNSPSAVVQRLVQPIRHSKRNVTCDNWFTSIPLIRTLFTEYTLTFLGTIRKNKKELPIEFSKPKGRPIGSTMFAYNANITIVSYTPKKNKNVLLASSLHHDDVIDTPTGKPDMILDYNATKGGVDTLDKMYAAYNCARNTNRWPMVIMYSLLNVAGVNSMVLFHLQNLDTRITRRKFLHMLSFELVENHLRSRATLTNIPKTITQRISEILKLPSALVPSSSTSTKTHGRCSYCDRKKNRPTRFSCKQCNKFMCLEHITCICTECYLDFTTDNNL